MIQYLCEVAEKMVWQDLVMELLDFEKHGQPNGVSAKFISFIHLSLTVKVSLKLNNNCENRPRYKVKTQGSYRLDQKQKEECHTFTQARLWYSVHRMVDELAAVTTSDD